MNRLSKAVHAFLATAVTVALPVCVVVVLWQLPRLGEPRQWDNAGGDLFDAIDRNDVAAVERCLARGTPVDATLETSHRGASLTPLMVAARLGRMEIARRLLSRGADLRATARGVNTPLACAAWHRGPDMVRLLLEHGADPNPRDGSLPPLISAVFFDNVAAAEALIAAGADVNACDLDGTPALMLAERLGDGEMVRTLLAAGATAAKADSATDEVR